MMTFQYNYPNFIPTEIEPHLCFDRSPVLGQPALDFPLWDLDQNKTSLSAIWSQFDYTIVEFGSFT